MKLWNEISEATRTKSIPETRNSTFCVLEVDWARWEMSFVRFLNGEFINFCSASALTGETFPMVVES